MHSLKRKDLIGTRKVTRCIWNLYCPYDDCPFNLSTDGKRNTSNFQNVDGCKMGLGQGMKNDRVLQGVREPYNLPHRCTQVSTETNTNKYSLQVREAVLRNSSLGTSGIQQADVSQALAPADIKEAQRRAMQLSYTMIRSVKAKLAHERNADKHS